jgi:hypothetical protein
LRKCPAARFISFKDDPIAFTNELSVQRLIEGIKYELSLFEYPVPPLRLIIIDTVSRAIQGNVDENGQMGMQTLLASVERIRREFHPIPSALLLHHTTASNPKKMRGSGALPDDVDAHVYLEILNQVNPKGPLVPLMLTNTKIRQGQAFDGGLRLTKKAVSLVDGPEEAASFLARINAIRIEAGEATLNSLGVRESCVIEEAPASSVTNGDDNGRTRASARRKGTKAKGLGINAQALVEALQKQPGGQFATEEAWRVAANVPTGSFHAAKKQVCEANLVILENRGARLPQASSEKAA